MSNTDKANSDYWTQFWENQNLSKLPSLIDKNSANYSLRRFHEFYQEYLKQNNALKLIEVGCGNSSWLTYFSNYYSFKVNGIDYSEFGCEQTKKILVRDKINGSIYLGNLFSPPENLISEFDIVCSFGVVEHFNDTADVIRHISVFAKPGATIITTIPNLTGITGWLQKWMNKPVYDIHKVMSLHDLENHIQNAGLEVIASTRIIPMSFGVTLDEYEHQKVKFKSIKKIILKCFQVIEKVVCIIDDKIIKLPCTELFCAGMIVIARKPASK